MSEISIVPSDLKNTANSIREQIADPFAKDMKDPTCNDFLDDLVLAINKKNK